MCQASEVETAAGVDVDGDGADETVLEALPDRLRVDGLDPGGLDTVEVNDEQLIVRAPSQ
ncbi:MAG: hypothetical protein VCF24_01420 [Candidatus Latescibacterota bacterium]